MQNGMMGLKNLLSGAAIHTNRIGVGGEARPTEGGLRSPPYEWRAREPRWQDPR
jgi:hypothetical protein